MSDDRRLLVNWQSPEERRAYMRRRYANLSPEEKAAHGRQTVDCRRRRLAKLSPEELKAVKGDHAERQRLRRQEWTPDQKARQADTQRRWHAKQTAAERESRNLLKRAAETRRRERDRADALAFRALENLNRQEESP